MMVGYLLGTASELEQSQIETRYFREPHFYEQMLALEEEVICDYLNRTLTAPERQRFEQYFLGSPRRRRKYESTRKLLAFVADQGSLEVQPPAPSTIQTWIMAWPGRLHHFLLPKLNFVWSLALVAALSWGVWLLSLQVAALRHEVGQRKTQQFATQKTKQRVKPKTERARPDNDTQKSTVADLADQLQASLDPTFLESGDAADATRVLSVNLRASHMRSPSEAQKISLPAHLTGLQVRLNLGSATLSPATNYQVILKTLSGQVIMRRQAVSQQILQSERSLTLEIPAQQLRTGVYALTVLGVTADQQTRFAEELFVQIER